MIAAFAALTLPAHAQLSWTVFDENTLSPLTSTTDRVSVTVPAGQRATLIATNFVPIDLTATTAAPVALTLTFTASSGLSTLVTGQRAIGFGLFNRNNTTTSFTDDAGYFTWLNGRNTGSLIELRRRNNNGPSSSLLNPTGASFSNLGTGSATQTAGAFTDGVLCTITLRLNRSASGVSLGTNTGADVAGVWLRGDGLSQTAYTNPDTPPAATLFNELAFMFQNTTGAAVTLTLDSITGVTVQASPAIVSQPQQLILHPGQTGTLTVTASGTPPLSYEWRRDGVQLPGPDSASYSTSTAGSYSVVVSKAFGSTVSAVAPVIISANPIPVTIDTHPVSLTVNAGQTAVFSVNAFGSAPLTYEWQKNSIAVPGGNGPTLAIASATVADTGIYSVVVRNATTSMVSQPAILTVNATPAITMQPVNQTANVGQTATFTVVATGTPAPTYQWRKGGANITGATNVTLSLANVQTDDAGSYDVVVSNSAGIATSHTATLTVNEAGAPVITAMSAPRQIVNLGRLMPR